MKYDSLGNRMKFAYENRYRFYLPEKIPVIIRLDGKSFHTFCRGLKKPFDDLFIEAMQKTMLELCSNISDCKLGYVESDEISLFLMQTKRESEPWFSNNLQKIVSVSASMATMYFNKFFSELVDNYVIDVNDSDCIQYHKVLKEKKGNAIFDSRAFILPEHEVINYFIWRQQDCTRNSIQSLAQSLYPVNEIKGIKNNVLQDKIFTEKGINWNDLTTVKKRGTCAVKKSQTFKIPNTEEEIIRDKMTLDYNIPIFSQEREYIENIVFKNKKGE